MISQLHLLDEGNERAAAPAGSARRRSDRAHTGAVPARRGRRLNAATRQIGRDGVARARKALAAAPVLDDGQRRRQPGPTDTDNGRSSSPHAA